MTYILNTAIPDVLNEEFLLKVHAFIAKGDAVCTRHLLTQLKTAHRLYWLEEMGDLIACVGLKNPLPSYRKKIFSLIQTPLPDQIKQTSPRLGWLTVHPDFRRAKLASQLVQYVRQAYPESYAVTRANKEWVRHILVAGGMHLCAEFVRNGKPYKLWY